MDTEEEGMRRDTSFPDANQTGSIVGNEAPVVSGRTRTLGRRYVLGFGLDWNPAFEGICASAHGPQSTPARVEALEEPDEREDEEDDGQELEPFVR